MSEVCVVDMSAATAIGFSMDEIWEGLCDGLTATSKIDRFDTASLEYHNGACIDNAVFDANENPISTLTDKVLSALGPVPTDAYPIWAGVKGDTPYLEGFYKGREDEAEYLPRHYRRRVIERLSLTEEGFDVNAACASSTVALALGATMIAEGRLKSVLVVAADVISRFIFTGFSALRGLTPSTCRPFDDERDGLILGDGAAAILLMEKNEAEKQGYKPRAKLSGWGIANDANHITGPAKDGRGLIRAISSAVRDASIPFEEVEAYCAHGTGTPYNDAMELTAVETLFGSRAFPVFSVKGSIGHTLGAAGALEAAIAVHALKKRKAPPTVGLISPDKNAVGKVCSKEQLFGGKNILTTNSGFGGCNAALLFESI